MEQDNQRKELTSWDKPLVKIGNKRYQEEHPNTSSRKRSSKQDSPYTKSSRAAHPAASSSSHGPASLANQQAASQAGKTGVNLAMPSFDLYSLLSQGRDDHMASLGLPPSALAALKYPHSGGESSSLPYTCTGMDDASQNLPQSTNDAPHLAFDPAASAPFDRFTYADIPPDHSHRVIPTSCRSPLHARILATVSHWCDRALWTSEGNLQATDSSVRCPDPVRYTQSHSRLSAPSD